MSIFNRVFRRKTINRQNLLNEIKGWRYTLLITRDPLERWVIQGWIRDIEKKLRMIE